MAAASDHTVPPESYLLIKQIDEWEKESIAKIQQRARELRERLLQLTIANTNQLIDNEHSDTSTIAINQYMSKPLVPNIYVVSTATNELFLKTSDNKVRIEENGQLAVHDLSIDTTEIQGRNAYTTGCHHICLRIQQSTNKWTFLGINSKLTSLQNPPHPCSSSYGWTTNHTIWSNGNPKSSLPDKSNEMKNGDIISLIIDCDKCLVIMINERMKVTHELIVNTDNCPFPWQLYVVLSEPNSRIKILRE